MNVLKKIKSTLGDTNNRVSKLDDLDDSMIGTAGAG